MAIEGEIKEGQKILAKKPGRKRPMTLTVQIVPGDGRVIVSPKGDSENAFIATKETIINGGTIDGYDLGPLTVIPSFNKR